MTYAYGDWTVLKMLSHFALNQTASGYVIQVETEDGEVIELLATGDQLDLISDSIGQRFDMIASSPDETGPDDGAE